MLYRDNSERMLEQQKIWEFSRVLEVYKIMVSLGEGVLFL